MAVQKKTDKIQVVKFVSVALTSVVLVIAIAIVFSNNAYRQAAPVSQALSAARATDGSYISWKEHRIDDEKLAGGLALRGADGLQLADLDQDGYVDVVSVHEDSGHIRIAFGNKDPDRWMSMTLASGPLVGGVEDVDIADVNRDGWLDLLFACEDGTILYYQNPGRQVRRSDAWKSTVPESTKGRGSWIKVYTADLDNDGDLEMIATNKGIKMYAGQGPMGDNKTAVSWFKIPDDPLEAEGWKEHELGRFIVPVNSRPVDIDRDGDTDIVAGTRGEARMVVFENDGAGRMEFTERPIVPNGRNVPRKPILPKKFSGMVMAYGDLNLDGRLDIVTFETPWSIVWLEQPDDLDKSWQVHPLAALFPDSPTALTLEDINGDGQLDLLTGGYSQEPRDRDVRDPSLFHRAGGIVWFEQPTTDQPWIRHDISRRSRGMFDAFIPWDVNGDGHMDFVGTRGNSDLFDGVVWIEQVRSSAPAPSFTPARKVDSQQLPPPPKWLQGVATMLLQ